MSLRLEMLQVARLAPKLLGESAELVSTFVLAQQNPDGGFRDRKGESDLYYTAFALDSLAALQKEVPRESLLRFLRSFGSGNRLDFVHLCCLGRCWASIESAESCEFAETADGIALNLEKFRSEDGGFNVVPGAPSGTAYGAFLGLGAFQDLRLPLSAHERLLGSVVRLRLPDGGFCNDSSAPVSATNPTAAAVTLLRNMNQSVERSTADWLMAVAHKEGGFRAAPGAPMPDLLSTATALHALSGLEVDFRSLRESSLDYIDTLWTNEGGFYGHWGEDLLDVEYTFYGLLALGHLSL